MMTKTYVRRGLALVVIACFAVMGAATAGNDEGGGDDESSQAASAALSELQTHLSSGSTYGEGPDGEFIAQAVRAVLAPGDGVAVRVVEGAPRKITVLVRYRTTDGYESLADISQSERNEELDRILQAIDVKYEGGADEIGLGIRGSFVYGAIAVRKPGQAVEYHSGTIVSTDVLDPMLIAEPGTPAPRALTLNQPVSGSILSFPIPQPYYTFTLAEPKGVRVRVTTDKPRESAPIPIVCAGVTRAGQCSVEDELEDEMHPEELVAEAVAAEEAAEGATFIEDYFSLQAGTYTVILFRNDCAGAEPCATDGANFTLTVL
ncbi:MAG: hypothetical protein AAGF12_01780 [Myxococcota bacterium]